MQTPRKRRLSPLLVGAAIAATGACTADQPNAAPTPQATVTSPAVPVVQDPGYRSVRAVLDVLAADGVTCEGTYDTTADVAEVFDDYGASVVSSARCEHKDPDSLRSTSAMIVIVFASVGDRESAEYLLDQIHCGSYVVGGAWSVWQGDIHSHRDDVTTDRVAAALGGRVRLGATQRSDGNACPANS